MGGQLVEHGKKMQQLLEKDSVKTQFQNALKENSGAFVASIIDLYNNDKKLKKCEPQKVIMEALKAASLKLPINKQLGFSYIIPYGNNPEFQLGYKGYIQLAMRTGQYKHINADAVPSNINITHNLLTGELYFEDTGAESEGEVQGYFAYMELLNGFNKTIYMTKEEMEKHGDKYSPSYKYSSSPWQTDFDKMAKKTVLRLLLSKYGVMSTEMMSALTSDGKASENLQDEINDNANQEEIDFDMEDAEEIKDEENVGKEIFGEEDGIEQPDKPADGPGF